MPDSDDEGATGHSAAGPEAELTCLMADVEPSGKSKPQVGSEASTAPTGDRDSKFKWSLLKDGSGVVVHVQGAPKVVVTPDHTNRRFHADFAEETGLNGSPAARAQMNAFIQKANPESADELGRLLKEARKQFREQTGVKGSGSRLLESDHGEFARNVIAAYFVADHALTSEVISDLPA